MLNGPLGPQSSRHPVQRDLELAQRRRGLSHSVDIPRGVSAHRES
jgi:hypothetical protein